MKQTNESRGKALSGGSIILTASSVFFFYISTPQVCLPIFVVVAGIRSGAGPIDCESDTQVTSPAILY